MNKLLLLVLTALVLLSPIQAKTPLTLGISQEVQCLAKNIYHEARGESFKGKLAVALVTINRTKRVGFPSTVCGVVYQKGQFSWTAKPPTITDWNSFTDAILAASMALEDNNILGHFTATHYHNSTVSPAWPLRVVARIGHHVFYS